MLASREKIINAAESLFASKGYDGVSVVEIAQKAKTSKSLVFHHFKTKENILLSLIKKRLGEFEDFLKKNLERKTPAKKLEQFIDNYLELLSKRSNFFKILFRETISSNKKITEFIITHNTRIAELINSIVEEGKKLGQFKPEIDPKTYSILLTTLLNSTAAIKALQSTKPKPFQIDFARIKSEIKKIMVEGVIQDA